MDIAQTPDFAALAISWLSRGGPENKLHLQLQSTKDHDSFDTVAPLIEHPSFRFSTLVLGVDILRRWKCVQSFMQPSASKATVEALTLRLPLQPPENPPIDPVPPGASISLLEAFPRAKSLVLQGHIKYAPVTHPSLTSLAIDGARLAASDLSCLSQNFPSLEELVIAGVSRHVEWDNSDLQSIVIPSLKRLTLTTDDTQKVMQALTCSNLQWLHLSDIPNAKWFDPLFQIELKAFIEKSKKTEFTLRVTSSQDSLGNILPGILAHSLPIHRLEVQGIDWLSRRRPILLFDGEHDIPSSLCEIVAWETPRKLKFIPRNVGAVRNGPLEGPRRTIEVYFPGGKEELDVLGVRCDEKESQVYLNFHCMSKEAIQHKMHRQNPILCHAYNKLLGLFDA
ncbi:hypothetical protein BKA70DRAFT_757988 [Coprinopsis sp. MPI-PUGE-AT-0042]|nr:hypothetical protein BKA70DRAFT_757988 [Coprinopsis sp. MPI-PUGE-AT-0042]